MKPNPTTLRKQHEKMIRQTRILILEIIDCVCSDKCFSHGYTNLYSYSSKSYIQLPFASAKAFQFPNGTYIFGKTIN